MTTRPWPPEVAEAQATGDVKAIFEDIKRVLGVPMVNLLYRRLAAEPAALAWAWDAIRSSAVDGEIERGVTALASPLRVLPDQVLPCAALRGVGIDADARAKIGAVIAAYNYANPRNLIGASIWARLLEGGPRGTSRSSAPTPAPPATRFPDVDLPPMIDIDEMDADTAALVHGLLKWRDPKQTPSVPSLYRHLANWPGFLALALVVLEPRFASGAVDEARNAVRACALSSADEILSRGRPRPPAPPAGRARALIEDIAGSYPTKIAELVVVGHMFAAMLPDRPRAT